MDEIRNLPSMRMKSSITMTEHVNQLKIKSQKNNNRDFVKKEIDSGVCQGSYAEIQTK